MTSDAMTPAIEARTRKELQNRTSKQLVEMREYLDEDTPLNNQVRALIDEILSEREQG